MPVSRMRMRPWLEQMIDSNSVSGLKWVDKEKTIFTIPWKHAARHGWELDKDACLFKKWAIHTGKYVQGQTSDPKTWKANFRCAMNSLPDIKEVKDKSVNKGHQAMRVFRMLPVTQKSRDKRSKGKETKSRKKSSVVKKEEDLEDYSDTQSPMDQSEDASSTQENTIDSTVNTEQTDFSFLTQSEVPDWSSAVEIEAESIHNAFCNRFQVSPDHNSSDDADAIIQICKQLEADSHWMLSSLDSRGVLNNEACTSPGSQWSDTSSDLEVDNIPRYITLETDYTNGLEDIWSSYCPNFTPLL